MLLGRRIDLPVLWYVFSFCQEFLGYGGIGGHEIILILLSSFKSFLFHNQLLKNVLYVFSMEDCVSKEK